MEYLWLNTLTMWALNSFFFLAIFAGIRTGDLWAILPVSVTYILLLTWLENDSDNSNKRTTSSDHYSSDRLLDDTHSDLDNTET